MDVTELEGLRVDATVHLPQGKTLPISFLFDAYTVEEALQLREAEQKAAKARETANDPAGEQKAEEAEEEALVSFIKVLKKIDLGWGLTENGEPYPVTEETLRKRGLKLINLIAKAIQEAQDPNPTSA